MTDKGGRPAATAGTNPSTTPDQMPDIPPGFDSTLRNAGLDPESPECVTKAVQISLMMYRGSLPLPPPPVLAEYEKVFPGLTERIIAWTEQQRGHRQSLERKRNDGAEKRMNRGQIIAGTVAIWGLTMAAVAGVWSAALGIAIAIVAIGGPTAAIFLASTADVKAPSKQFKVPKDPEVAKPPPSN